MLPEAIEREVTRYFTEFERNHVEPAGELGVLGGECVGSKHHSPRPLMVYEVRIPGQGDVMLCGVCRDNLRLLERLQGTPGLDEPLPWDAHRQFGNEVRRLAGGRKKP